MDVEAASTVERDARQVTYLDRLLRHVPLHRALARSVECRLLSEVELAPPALDLGCGDGTLAAACYDQPLAAGIDVDRRMLRKAAAHRAHCLLAAATGAALPFHDGTFRSVLCNSTLEHIEDRQGVLREAARVLVPGGTLVLTVPSEHFFHDHLGCTFARALRAGLLARLYERWIRAVARVYHADPPEIWEQELAEAGFLVRDRRYYLTAGSTRAMDAAQYLSLPSLLTRRLLGRWVIWPGKGRYLPLVRWLVRLAREGDGSRGAFLIFRCEKIRGVVP